MTSANVLHGRLRATLAMTAVLLASASHLAAQASGSDGGSGSPDPLKIEFLARPPLIDGAPDPGTEALAPVPLPVFLNRADGAPATAVTVRLAYGADFLYLFLEAAQDSLRCRDRAYQNGDGVIVTLATPVAGDAATDEFQVLGFSPQPGIRRTWQYAFTWYKDRDWVGFPPLRGAAFAWSHEAGMARFEILVPWSEVAPYHPWFITDIGLNVGYTQAVGREGVIEYQLTADPRLMYEVSPRLYRRARFIEPALDDGTLTAAVSLEASHATAGEPLVLRTAAHGDGAAVFSAIVRQGRRELSRTEVPVKAPAEGLAAAAIDTTGLVPGEYDLEVRDAAGAIRRFPFGILPGLDLAALRTELSAKSAALPRGTLSTLEFRLQEAERGLAELRPHSLASALGRELASLEQDFRALRGGDDPVADRAGVQRRAFRSRIDGTLQPYSIRPVASPKPGRTYPVVVFLHGSAADDRGQLDGWQARLPGFILVAPYARGTSHYYATAEAQEDISEVLDDVATHYPVDTAKIFLAGFSMGGYGVYRTFAEDPRRYRGLIVLSGIPSPGGEAPDFRDPERLACFTGVDMFVTHGTEDRNCPFADTERMVGLLRGVGARVEFVVQRGRGHESPTLATAIRMLGWLKRAARR